MRRGDIVKIQRNTSAESDTGIIINTDNNNNVLLVPLFEKDYEKNENFPQSIILKKTDYSKGGFSKEKIAVFVRVTAISSKNCQIVGSLKSRALDLCLRKFTELTVSFYYSEFHRGKSFKAGETKVNYSGRVYDEKEICALVNSALDFWLTAGHYARELEKRICDYFGAKKFYLVNSGSSANLIMVSSLCSKQFEGHLNPGDEVITPAVTFPTTLTPILQNNLVPVFVDCEIGTYNINPILIEPAISPKTRAIFIPHTLGNPCNMDIIMAIVKKHNLLLMEDACDALGATYNGKLVGTFGAMAALSFYPAHHITMGEGGGVIINDYRFTKIALSIRDWGRDCWCEPGHNDTCGKRFAWQWGKLPYGYDHKYVYSNIGYNLKITDMQAAIGLAQLDKVKEFIESRRENFKFYYEHLKKYGEKLILPKWEKEANPSWFGFPITVREGIDVNKLISYLEKAKIETRKVFAGNILLQPAFLDIKHRVYGSLDNTNRIMRDSFFLGVYPGLTRTHIDYVLEIFDKFMKHSSIGRGVRSENSICI